MLHHLAIKFSWTPWRPQTTAGIPCVVSHMWPTALAQYVLTCPSRFALNQVSWLHCEFMSTHFSALTMMPRTWKPPVWTPTLVMLLLEPSSQSWNLYSAAKVWFHFLLFPSLAQSRPPWPPVSPCTRSSLSCTVHLHKLFFCVLSPLVFSVLLHILFTCLLHFLVSSVPLHVLFTRVLCSFVCSVLWHTLLSCVCAFSPYLPGCCFSVRSTLLSRLPIQLCPHWHSCSSLSSFPAVFP